MFSIFFLILYACNPTPKYETIDGILEVPENRQNPDSRTLKLVYKILKAKKADSLKAPIVLLQGGPGGATITMEAFWENNPLRDDRDIVLMDQRGTGESQANCTDIGKAMFNILRQDLTQEGEIKALDSVFSECKKTMKKNRVDLAGYNSKENAADFEDLRIALGYDKWNLFGGSYGSRLGLTIMRDFPNSVRSSVLASILAPETNFFNATIRNLENSLFSVLELCDQNEDCNNQYPNLKNRLLKTLKKLQTEPLRLDYEDKAFVLNSQDALILLFMNLYDRNSISSIPLLINALEKGEPKPLKNAIKNIGDMYNFINWSMNYSVMVYEELPFYDAAALKKEVKQSTIIEFDSISFALSDKLAANWHSFRATDFENQPVVSEIPTLIASGGLDHVTPPSNATEALKHLKNGYGILFPDEGHNIMNPCFLKIAKEFINNPSQKPNIDCSSIRKPIEWDLSPSF
ncbi:alpha/beta hydrolase [Maribacter hydrothermalis]|uniref:Proline iminopeptidase n=1 Tax=Maribacter hydrothermalis TaxID=1836467 RepID=A0A1B7Z4D7_9FLAO|nr:alpha/beta fold hydrolase [Maribacter hydrothermalis]APQ17149.1 hypothetical protein BTR34_07335 [Maribacter hydrothermalis]OBR37410.1 hypothetical protein A9200_07085 [Maribacter hydrothermalis]